MQNRNTNGISRLVKLVECCEGVGRHAVNELMSCSDSVVLSGMDKIGVG